MSKPPWPTILIFALLVTQMVSLWIQAKKNGKDVWHAVRASAFLVIASAIILVRENVGEIPAWTELALLIPLAILLAFAVWWGFIQAKAYLQNIGLVAKKKQ